MTKVAIMGYGTVGSGLIELIDKNREINNSDICITSILVKDRNECLGFEHYEIITDDIEEFFNHESEVIIELIGGVDPAFNYVKRALENKKHVVTANKDLIATHGEELFKLANLNNVSLKFEASVGGGIPIIKPITETLAGNEISSIRAILNGTTNFILTKMDKEGLSYDEALREAQILGFAEANADSDVMGYDAARKLAILSTLSFNRKLNWKELNIEGITNIDEKDFEYAKKYNCKIKLLGQATRSKCGIHASVKPVLVKEDSIFANINNEVNIVVLDGPECGELSFIGKGAGKLPTGSAVYGDLNDIIQGRFNKITAFSEEKVDCNFYSNTTCNCIVRVRTTSKESIVEKFREFFNNMKVIDRNFNDEVAIYIDCTSEAYVEKFIKTISLDEEIISYKKLILA